MTWSGPPVEGLSVVIPTYGRVDLVRTLLASCLPAGARIDVPWEVIVVDTSPVPAAEQIRAACAQWGARYVPGPPRVGAKRNRGAELARHEVVLFIDSDCAATPELFAEHLRAYRQDPPAGPVGVVGRTVMRGEEGLLWRVLSRSHEYGIPYSWPRYFAELAWGTTANLSVRRSAFLTAGGFAEDTWTVAGGEDVDLCVRLGAAGGRLVGAPDAVVAHARSDIRGVRQISAKLLDYGRSDNWLVSRFPDRVQWRANPVVVVAAATAVGLATALARRRWRWALTGPAAIPAMMAATLVPRIPDLRGPNWYLEPFCLLVDWSFDAGIVWSAVAHRRPRSALQRFRYYSPQHFTLRPEYRSVPRVAFSARAAIDWEERA